MFAGAVSTFAGTGVAGKTDGPAANATFFSPMGIAVNHTSGDLYISDFFNHTIRKITLQGIEGSYIYGS